MEGQAGDSHVPVVLTVAGSDSSGGAGIQADLKTLTAMNVYGASAITALTAQNTTGVQAIHTPPTDFLKQQLESVFSDLRVSAVKTGMLPTSAMIETTAAFIRAHSVRHVVVDPVLAATSGDTLVTDSAHTAWLDALTASLLPLATLVTPNMPEARRLTGLPIRNDQEARAACRALHALGCRAVLLKGGHRHDDEFAASDPAAGAAAPQADGCSGGSGAACDLLYDGCRFDAFCAPWVDTRNTHGSGCTLASAIAAGLACGQPLRTAVASAKRYVSRAIEASLDLGQGHGPLYHMHTVRPLDERGEGDDH